ncbi:MAG: RsmE family RNA methyltransferase [Myxococcales bacterium]|nr:RsmE family RNA methyltransferase [Myxococcales bacterium]MDD9970582.1 RsmE family RNA methyltransferase [Myxococcales bacterium]
MAASPPYLLVTQLPPDGGTVALSQDAQRHARVLRLGAGDPLVLFDGMGARSDATMVGSGRGAWVCHAQPPIREAEPLSKLTMILGLTKGDKLDTVVRMLTELGVHQIGLGLCERTVPDPRSPELKRRRLERIAVSACAQARRAWVPRIEGPASLLQLAREAPQTALRVVFWEATRGSPSEALAPSSAAPPSEGSDMWVVVGPEGGLSVDEVGALEGSGYVKAGLGQTILRAETAAVAAAAVLTLAKP